MIFLNREAAIKHCSSCAELLNIETVDKLHAFVDIHAYNNSVTICNNSATICNNSVTTFHSIYLLFTHGVFIFAIIADNNTPLALVVQMVFKPAPRHDGAAVWIWAFHVFEFTLVDMLLKRTRAVKGLFPMKEVWVDYFCKHSQAL